MSSTAKKLADSFRKQHPTGSPTPESLKAALARQGYTVVLFSSAYNDEPTTAIIRALHLQDYVRSSKGFTYSDAQYRLVFLHEGLSDEEAVLVLLHEQGHISCGHMHSAAIMGQDVLQENEANEFAHYVLHPGFGTQVSCWLRAHRKPLLIGLAVLLALGIGLGIWFGIAGQNSYYVTATGGKYHDRDCIFVRDKDNVTEMSLQELQKTDYTPCEVCNPNK